MLSMILAMDKNKLIGNTSSKNGLPWHYKEDLKFYKEKTINKKNIMGRKTYEQIGKALPNRTTYVLSKDKELRYSDAIVINSLEEVLKMSEANKDEEIVIIGGIEIFELFKPYVDVIYLTLVEADHKGDVYYKKFNTDNFHLISEEQGETKELLFQKWGRNAS